MCVHACVCMCICACVCIHVERGLRLMLNVFLYIFSILFKNYMFICFLIYWYIFPCTHIYSHILLSEDKSQELIPSWHHVGPRDGTQAFRLGSKCLHLLSHLHWALHCIFWDRVFTWTRSSLLQLDWHTGRPQGYSHLCLLNTGVTGTDHYSSLLCGCWGLNSSPHSCAPSTLPTKPSPSPPPTHT